MSEQVTCTEPCVITPDGWCATHSSGGGPAYCDPESRFVAHAHGCRLPPDHDGGCVTDTPHQFGPDGCEHCKDSTRLPGHSGSD